MAFISLFLAAVSSASQNTSKTHPTPNNAAFGDVHTVTHIYTNGKLGKSVESTDKIPSKILSALVKSVTSTKKSVKSEPTCYKKGDYHLTEDTRDFHFLRAYSADECQQKCNSKLFKKRCTHWTWITQRFFQKWCYLKEFAVGTTPIITPNEHATSGPRDCQTAIDAEAARLQAAADAVRAAEAARRQAAAAVEAIAEAARQHAAAAADAERRHAAAAAEAVTEAARQKAAADAAADAVRAAEAAAEAARQQAAADAAPAAGTGPKKRPRCLTKFLMNNKARKNGL